MFTTIVKSIQRKARLLGAMLDRLGIDPERAARVRSGAALTAASRTCLGCTETEACETWLAEPVPDEPQSSIPPAFCPNKEFLARACVRRATWPR
jgi:hypothetical protein